MRWMALRLDHWTRSAGMLGLSLTALAACNFVENPATAEPESSLEICEIAAPCESPLPVKAVLVTMFEIGMDEGDRPGEFQLWKERRPFDVAIPFPHSHHDLYYDPEAEILAIVTGIGTAKSSASTMALGLDTRFDLSKAYWLVAGIAGIDPEDASIAMMRPLLPMAAAIASVFPPAPAQKSTTFIPGLASTRRAAIWDPSS